MGLIKVTYVVIDSYQLLEDHIYYSDLKHVVIYTDKIIPFLHSHLRAPANTRVYDVPPSVEGVDKAITVECSSREDCLQATKKAIYDLFDSGVYILEVWFVCPCMAKAPISRYEVGEDGEVRTLGVEYI